jgi:hypothetical protein
LGSEYISQEMYSDPDSRASEQQSCGCEQGDEHAIQEKHAGDTRREILCAASLPSGDLLERLLAATGTWMERRSNYATPGGSRDVRPAT